MLSATLNKTLLAWITELNVPGAVPPQVWRDAKPSEDLKTRSERDKNLVEVGYRPTLEHITEAYGGEWEPVPASAPAAHPVEPGQEFAEGRFPDQEALDRAADGLPAARLDQDMTAMLEPVFEALRRGDAAEAQSLLADAYPGLDAKGLEDLLARALFVSELWGRLNAGR
jgi:phage gp29-like protein